MINVHNNWDPLEEIWLGDVYPAHFYDDLEPEVRDSFYQLTEWTKQDLTVIENKLKEFGVIVRRPTIDGDKSNYLFKDKFLLKPPICPRDENAVIADKLYMAGQPNYSYQSLKQYYPKENIVEHGSRVLHQLGVVSGACIVKLGRDIIFDFWVYPDQGIMTKHEKKQKVFEHYTKFLNTYANEFADYRIHYSTNGGHADACFMPVKPGLVLTTHYWNDYQKILPNWQHINIKEPSWVNAQKMKKIRQSIGLSAEATIPNNGGNNWVGFIENMPRHFNGYVKKFCKEWIGNYKETFFEVNTIMLDEKNLLCIDSVNAYDPLYEELEKHGVTVHALPWRTRGFWDGGMHCITLDIRRKSTIQDYFPNNEGLGVKRVYCNLFIDQDQFFNEYNDWKKNQ
jgi:hypothetical protein